MRIVHAQPPIYAEIVKVFPSATLPGTVFCWGGTIYAPGTTRPIPKEIIVHERVHCMRQGDDVEGWWRRYLADPAFRLEEEIPAHAAELIAMFEIYEPQWVSKSNMRRTFTARVARRLASPLYGPMITLEAAKAALTALVP